MAHNAMDNTISPYDPQHANFQHPQNLYSHPFYHAPLNSQPPGSLQIPQLDTTFSSAETFEQFGSVPQRGLGMPSENNTTLHQTFLEPIESIQHRSTCAETSDGLTDTVASQESSRTLVQPIRQDQVRNKRKINSPSLNIPSSVQTSERIFFCPYPGCDATGFRTDGLLR